MSIIQIGGTYAKAILLPNEVAIGAIGRIQVISIILLLFVSGTAYNIFTNTRTFGIYSSMFLTGSGSSVGRTSAVSRLGQFRLLNFATLCIPLWTTVK